MSISHGQRTLWMVLATSLAAPFFASLIYVGLTALASVLGHYADLLLPSVGAEPLGEVAVDAFAWSALPATVAGLGLSPFVLEHGTYSWLQAAVAGVLGFAAGAIIFPFGSVGASLAPLAFIAGLLAIAMRAVLISSGILLPAPKRR